MTRRGPRQRTGADQIATPPSEEISTIIPSRRRHVDHGCGHCGILDLTDRKRAADLGLYCSTRHCVARDLGLVA